MYVENAIIEMGKENAGCAKAVYTDENIRKCIKESIETLLGKKKKDGTYLMTKCRCWLAVYRVLADFGIIKAYEFKEFERIIRSIFHGEKLRLSINGKYLQKYSTKDDIFSRHHTEWRRFHGKGEVRDNTFRECRAVITKYFHIFKLKYNLMNREKRDKLHEQ